MLFFPVFFSQKLDKRRSARTSLLNKYKTTDIRKYKFVLAKEMNLGEMSSEIDEDGNVYFNVKKDENRSASYVKLLKILDDFSKSSQLKTQISTKRR